MKKTPLIFIGIILLCSTLRVHSQEFFKKIDKSKIKTQNFTQFNNKKSPTKYKSLSFKIDDFRDYVGSASKEKVINIPTPDNSYSKFLIKETSNFHPKLAEKYPMIKSYTAQGIDDPNATLSMSDGAGGIHITVSSPDKETYFIDTASKNSTGSSRKAILYKKNDLPPNKNSFSCQVEATMGKSAAQKNSTQTSNDGKLRTFRMALVCTKKFANFVIKTYGYEEAPILAKKALILSAMNTTMTRVNDIFRKEFGVELQLVAENDLLIEFALDPSSKDFFDNSDNEKMISKNQEHCDEIIRSDNYDIGHLFAEHKQFSSGRAKIESVCKQDKKAQGVSVAGRLGDSFDIDLVAHEIGHQFGANHTFNSSCDKNRNDPTAVEPGSGSTIMGYAGRCKPKVNHVQNDSDAYFHAESIAQILEYIKTDATCASIKDYYNIAPTANAGKDFTIPAGTPFVLRGIATDADGLSSLTHAWEQTDHEIAKEGPPVATNLVGPMFRSLPPTYYPNRYMPALDTVVEGATSMWEVLPTVARDLNFSYTVRDNH
ncbi:MAG: zinc-dependent metalloprotease family protein, partial [Polaribacter sp.]|nr:zinc-dependent metalloprotease family protein [Polaribacter sp.]